MKYNNDGHWLSSNQAESPAKACQGLCPVTTWRLLAGWRSRTPLPCILSLGHPRLAATPSIRRIARQQSSRSRQQAPSRYWSASSGDALYCYEMDGREWEFLPGERSNEAKWELCKCCAGNSINPVSFCFMWINCAYSWTSAPHLLPVLSEALFVCRTSLLCSLLQWLLFLLYARRIFSLSSAHSMQ